MKMNQKKITLEMHLIEKQHTFWTKIGVGVYYVGVCVFE